ncbi:MAG: gluconokinase [Pseudonocardia sp.]
MAERENSRARAGMREAAAVTAAVTVTVTLVVAGVSGVGKSTIAAELVARTGWAFQEGDELHPAPNVAKMAAGAALDDRDRGPWLHRVAGWIGAQESAGRDAVVTCSALRRTYRDVLCAGHPSVRFVNLLAPPELVQRRLAARQGHYMPPSLLATQLDALEPLDPDEPGVQVPAGGSPGDVADRALALLRDMRG